MSDKLDDFDFMAEGDENSTIGLPKLNFGKCTITSKFIKWEDKTPEEVTAQQFSKLDAKQRSQEVSLSVDIQEFNPNLQFVYTRRVNVGGIDWNKILKPSLFKALGVTPNEDKAEQGKQVAAAMRKLNGAYACVEDVPQSLTGKDKKAGITESKYNTAKVITIYASRVECYEKWKSTYNVSNGNGASAVAEFASGIPADYTAESWAEQKDTFLTAYQTHVKTLTKGTVPQKRKLALEHVAENEAGSTPEQLAELIGV